MLTVVLYLYWIKPNSKSLEEKLNDLESTLAQMRQEGYEMLAPLNNLFHSEMTAELIKKAIPFIHMDSNFNIERYEQLVKDYGFLEKRGCKSFNIRYCFWRYPRESFCFS